MKYYLVSYSYGYGFGRKLFGTSTRIDEAKILKWEASCAKASCAEIACILAISEIDGPIEARP